MTPEDTALPQLPVLSQTPATYAGCCLGLSTTLLSHLHSVLPTSGVVVSIGSGAGLLEALLNHDPYRRDIIGVEVEPSPNYFLTPEHHHGVLGTRFLSKIAADATAWLFVYPRRVGLVEEYIETYGAHRVELIIWIGPNADWSDYRECFLGSVWDVYVRGCEEVGGRGWECVAVASKRKKS